MSSIDEALSTTAGSGLSDGRWSRGGDIQSRANWIGLVREQLESHQIPWSFWTLLSYSGTRRYEPDTAQWALPLTRSLGLSVTN